MTKLVFKREETWIPGDSPLEAGYYWVTWSINGEEPWASEMFWDGSKWMWGEVPINQFAKVIAYADVCYPEPYEQD